MKWKNVVRILVIPLLMFLVACGIDGKLKKQAQGLNETIANTANTVKEKQKEYQSRKNQSGFEFFKIYAEREKWDKAFTGALAETDRLLGVHKKDVMPIVDRNKSEEERKLKKQVNRVISALRQVIISIDQPRRRMAELKAIQREAPERINKAKAEMKEIDSLITAIDPVFKKANAYIEEIAKPGYQKRLSTLAADQVGLIKLQSDVKVSLDAAEVEFKNHQSESFADYAILGKGTKDTAANLAVLRKRDADLRKKMEGLYHAYKKVLSDMKIEYFVVIGRVGWDNYYDYPTEHTYKYRPRKVSAGTYEYFSKLPPDTVPAKLGGWGGYKIKINKSHWDQLRINPQERWWSGDDEAEFWIEDAYPVAYHKYTIIQDGRKGMTDWVELDDIEEYYDREEDLGMEIVSKPRGMFEDEVMEEAAPAGMAQVGDKRHGEWRRDSSSGRSFWYYYGIYSFLNGRRTSYIYRDGWNTWRRDYRGRRPYYGSTRDGTRRYGTYGRAVRTDSRYASTSFAKRGGLKSAPVSVRSAGSSRKGRGPGRKGK